MIFKLFVESQNLMNFSNLNPQKNKTDYIKYFISLFPVEYNRPLSPTLYAHHTAMLLDDFI